MLAPNSTKMSAIRFAVEMTVSFTSLPKGSMITSELSAGIYSSPVGSTPASISPSYEPVVASLGADSYYSPSAGAVLSV